MGRGFTPRDSSLKMMRAADAAQAPTAASYLMHARFTGQHGGTFAPDYSCSPSHFLAGHPATIE